MRINEKIIPLEQILAQEPLILMDTGAGISQNRNSYTRGVYPAKTFAEIDALALLPVIDDYTNFESIFQRGNIYTVETVKDEITRFAGILNEKLITLNSRCKGMERHKKNIDRCSSEEYIELTKFNRDIFENLCYLTHKVSRIAAKKVIPIENFDLFGNIGERVYHIAEQSGIKTDYGYRHDLIDTKKNEDLHADEELATMGIYLTVGEQKPTTILTSDSDIAKIINYSVKHLEELNRWKGIKDLLEVNPLRVFFMDPQKEFRLTFDTSKPENYF